MDKLLSIYVDEMGIYFWEDQVVDSDGVRYKIEEDFGISHNRTMDIEVFQEIMSRNAYVSIYGKYTIIRDETLIEQLISEFK